MRSSDARWRLQLEPALKDSLVDWGLPVYLGSRYLQVKVLPYDTVDITSGSDEPDVRRRRLDVRFRVNVEGGASYSEGWEFMLKLDRLLLKSDNLRGAVSEIVFAGSGIDEQTKYKKPRYVLYNDWLFYRNG